MVRIAKRDKIFKKRQGKLHKQNDHTAQICHFYSTNLQNCENSVKILRVGVIQPKRIKTQKLKNERREITHNRLNIQRIERYF